MNTEPLKRKCSTIFFRVFRQMLLLVVLEFALFALILQFSGLGDRLGQNADRMLAQQVENRRSYLYSSMNSYWSDLKHTAAFINEAAADMVERGELNPADLENYGGLTLLDTVAPELFKQVHEKRVSGVF